MASLKGSLSEPLSHPGPPSSSTEGFFQKAPELTNLFYEDEAYKRVFSFYLPQAIQEAISPDVSRFGSLVQQPQVLAWTADAERNPPYVRNFDTWGRRSNTLITSEGWRNLQELGITEGIVAIAYENQFGAYSRLYQFFKHHLWTPASALVTCPSAMHDGATRLLATYLARKDIELSETECKGFENAYRHLTSRDPKEAWTSGQWMTERSGGSDVRNTETQATYTPEFTKGDSTKDIDGLPLGPWVINGFKWFSSATDSHMAIALAKTPSGALSTFFVPMRRQTPNASHPEAVQTELNGITIQRLKSKLGTRPLPTAELVLSGTRAYIIGQPGQGVEIISTILNITRVHNTISALGAWGAGLSIARAFSRVRKTSGVLLTDISAHMHTLAAQHVEYRAMMQLSFFTIALLGIAEAATPVYTASDFPYEFRDASHTPLAAATHLRVDVELAPVLLRLLTPICKAIPAKAAIAGLQECMECLGGVGYLENEEVQFNIARLYRDMNVTAIWEGTTNVMADDLLRVVKSPRDGKVALQALDKWLESALTPWKADKELRACAAFVRAKWAGLKDGIEKKTLDELKLRGRELMWDLSWIIITVLLGRDAKRDDDPIALEVFQRWFAKKKVGQEERDWRVVADWDKRIVFGDNECSVEQRAKL